MGRLLLIALASFAALLASVGDGFAQEINPYTGRPYSRAAQEYRDRIRAEEEPVERGNEEARKADEALRREKAADLAADEARIRQWLKDHPSPPGTAEVFVSSSYGDGYVLEKTRIVYFNKYDDPTHEVELGPDGKETGPVRQTQQGKAWETIGPRVPEGGYPERSYGPGPTGDEIITGVEITAKGGRVVARYDFNHEGAPWRGETFDPETRQRTGGFQDERMKPPPPTKGEPLAVPPTLRLITGVCPECRPAADRHNELAAQINRIAADMQSQSAQHQATDVPRAKIAIRERHAALQGQLDALMPRYEAARAEALACKCPPPAQPEPPKPATALPGAEPESILDDIEDPFLNPEPAPYTPPEGESILDDIEDPPPVARTPSEQPVTPSKDIFPPSDADLDEVIRLAQAYLAAAECEEMECPKIDCMEARRALQALADMDAYLKQMGFYLERSNADHMARFTALAESSIINAEQQRKLILAIGYQEFLHNMGSMLLDIASIMQTVKDIATDDKGWREMNPIELLDRLDTLYEGAKDAESLLATGYTAKTGKEAWTPVGDAVDIAGGANKDLINDLTSYVSDAKSIAVDARKIYEKAKLEGKDWKEEFSKSGIMAAAGQMAGRYLKAWSAADLAERKKLMDDLLAEADEGDLMQTQAYRDLQRVQSRRFKAEDALDAVRRAYEAYLKCVQRACGLMTVTGPVVPEFEQHTPDGRTLYNWGKALPWLNGAVAQTLPKMRPVLFRDECPPEEKDQTYADPGQPPAGVVGQPTASLPPGAVRPQFERVNLTLPASFCSEFERNDFLTGVYNPAAAAALNNARAAQGYQTRLNGLFTEYMRNEGGPVWAAIQKEMAEFQPIADAAQAEAVRIPTLYDDILAIPIVDCPKTAQAEDPPPPAVSTGQPVTPASDPKRKPDCPPEDRRARRQPINVGPNSRVGSGARFRAKAASTALGLAGNLLGGGGLPGGGGGGGGGPQTVICKIKDSEMTVFTDPVTGVALRVGAKRAGGTLVVFADVAKSPDNGTFQAAYMENAAGETLAPSDVGICELWGEWKLTVSWTKSTYQDGVLVRQEKGGWVEKGRFSIPGVLSTVERPDGLWKRLGFSNASHGARKIAMQYKLPAGGAPLDTVIHVTRPGEDPVTTVPFAIRITEGPNGISLSKAPEVKEDCPPPESILDDVDQPSAPTPPSQPAIPSAPPPSGPTTTRPKPGGTPVTDVVGLDKEFDDNRFNDGAMKTAMEQSKLTYRENCKDLIGEMQFRDRRDRWVARLRARLAKLETLVPTGQFADSIRQAIEAETARTKAVLKEAQEMEMYCPTPGFENWPPPDPGGKPPEPARKPPESAPQPDPGDKAPESILDDIEESPPVIG